MDYALLQANSINSWADSNLYYRQTTNLIIILILYVDHLLIRGNDDRGIAQLKSQLLAQSWVNLGHVQKYFGVEFKRTMHSLLLHQTSYACNLLNEFHMADSTPINIPIHGSTYLQHDTKPINVTLYHWMVGKRHYLTKTQLDLQYAVNVVSQHMHAPQSEHLHDVRHIFRYIQKYMSLGFFFGEGEDTQLLGLPDANYAFDLNDQTSTTTYIFLLGSTPISWCCWK
jgi:hypothetical protein